MKHVSRRVLCKIEKLRATPLCSSQEAFRENTDHKLILKWNQILSSIPVLDEDERNALRSEARKQGIHEIFRQTLAYAKDYIQVRDFQQELEKKYGRDTRSRKGNEIIFTTEQLLESRQSCEPIVLSSSTNMLCPMQNSSVIN